MWKIAVNLQKLPELCNTIWRKKKQKTKKFSKDGWDQFKNFKRFINETGKKGEKSKPRFYFGICCKLILNCWCEISYRNKKPRISIRFYNGKFRLHTPLFKSNESNRNERNLTILSSFPICDQTNILLIKKAWYITTNKYFSLSEE